MTPTPSIRRMLSTALEVYIHPAGSADSIRCLCVLKVPSVGLELGTHFEVSKDALPDAAPVSLDNTLVGLSQAHLREALLAVLTGTGDAPSPLSLSSPVPSPQASPAPSSASQLQRDYDALKAKYDQLFLRTVGLHDAGRG